jgi:hypothetical protein
MKTPVIAIADDDLGFANYLTAFLEGRGYQTRIYALDLGAVNYIVKPDDPEGLGEIALDTALRQAIEMNQLVLEVTKLRRQVTVDEARAAPHHPGMAG